MCFWFSKIIVGIKVWSVFWTFLMGFQLDEYKCFFLQVVMFNFCLGTSTFDVFAVSEIKVANKGKVKKALRTNPN